MTDLQDQLAQIKARAEKATEGPWDFEPGHAYVFAEHMVGYPICDVETTAIPEDDWDAEFIAAARTDVPRLLEAVEAVLKEAKDADNQDRLISPSILRKRLAAKLTGEDDE